MEKKSIYRKIETEIQEKGRLPEDFQAEEREYKEDELRFAPGAMEGILGHHSSGKSEGNDFITTVKEYIQIPFMDALQKFETEKADDFQTAAIRGGLLKDIYEHREELEAGKIADLAYYFAANGTKCETVKLGLSMMALFDFSENETVCALLRTLGYCEDFTDYVLMNVEDWEEKKRQDFYFELAQKLHGWGKINVVEMMEADTEEKKHWILCHGCRNSVLNDYLGLECAQKCDLYDRLQKGGLSEEEFRGAGDIMEGLLDEGPCSGMSAMEHPVELTICFLEELKKYIASDIYYVALLNWINDYFMDSEIEKAELVCEKVQEVMASLDIHSVIAENIREKTYDCIQAAKLYGLDITQDILELMQEDLEKYFKHSYYLMKDDRCVDRFLELCEREVDPLKYPKGMGNSLGLGKLGEGILPLDMVVQYLDKYPLKGKKLIVISLQSPIVRWRCMAGKALLGWTKKLNRSLSEIDSELYAMVQTVAATECSKHAKEDWEKLK